MKKLILNSVAAVAILCAVSSCVERRYVRTNHHHSPEYYGRRHMTPPPEVDITVHRRY